MMDVITTFSLVLFASCSFYVTVVTAFECDVKLLPVGCFQDSIAQRALPEQLLNERDKTSYAFGGTKMSWTDPNYLPSFVCRCARLAKSKGYMYFGIQFYSECWSGPNSKMLHDKHGTSDKCSKNWHETPNCDVHTGEQEANYVYKILDRQCETDFSPIGCFNDKQVEPRPLPNYVLNDRDPTDPSFSGKKLDWNKYKTFLPHFICRCAQLALDRGDDFFAVQFYAECWTGKEGESDYSRDGVTDACAGEDLAKCNCTAYHCTGEEKVNFVYKLNRKTEKRDVVGSYPETERDVVGSYPKTERDVVVPYPKKRNYFRFRDILSRYRRPRHYRYDYPKYRTFDDYMRRYDADDLKNVDDDYKK